MRKRVQRLGVGVVVGIAAWTLGEPAAGAQELCDGKVCPEAFTCETYTSSCAEDDPDCVVFTETYCQSPECATDSDCPAGRRCRVTTYPGCVPPPEDGTGGGAATPPEECPDVTESWCDLSYDLPCETAAECGDGWSCVPLEDCDCSDPSCACEYTMIKGCYSPIVACAAATAATDCPSGWSCIENVNGLCNVVGDFHGGCNPGDPPMVCVPPGFDGDVGSVLDEDGAGPTGAAGSSGKSSATAAPSSDGGGCSIAASPGSGAGALLGVLSALWLRSRRRRAR